MIDAHVLCEICTFQSPSGAAVQSALTVKQYEDRKRNAH